ncbi:MAG: GNAT family N-acetyltransferase [Candidatus Bathyarchaeia archaeon]|jgi:GNAT superfamily N-acetyltransferase
MPIRKANVKDAEGIAKVHIDSWRTAYQGIYSEECLSNLSYDECQNIWATIYLAPTSQDAVFVAEDDSKNIVGFAICGKDRDNDPIYEGELIGIYILEKMQRQGIGRRLVNASTQYLRSRGFNSMMVWVLAVNPSRHFYEKLGGEHVQTRDITTGGRNFKEWGYGWKSLGSLFFLTK